MSKIKQLQPSYACHIEYVNEKVLDKLFNQYKFVCQPKYDGERLLLHLDEDNTYCTSRRISVKTEEFNEISANLPTLHIKLNLCYTVLDGEIYSKDWSTIAGITKSLPERAIELQKENKVKYAVFDCLFFDGLDIRDMSYEYRYNIAQNVVNLINKEYIHVVESFDVNSRCIAKDLMNKYINLGFEGIVVKNLSAIYGEKNSMLKLKKSITVDCIVYNYTKGNGKYINTIGALCLGYYDLNSESIIHITQCSPGTDAERQNWFENWNNMRYKIVEVKCQEITKKSLRHPVIVRIRDDKNYIMCTKDTIFSDTL